RPCQSTAGTGSTWPALGPTHFRVETGIRDGQTRAAPASASPCPLRRLAPRRPCKQDAHAGPEAVDPLQRPHSYLEALHVITAGLARRSPGREISGRADEIHLETDILQAQRGNVAPQLPPDPDTAELV